MNSRNGKLNGGLKFLIYLNFYFGPISSPKASFGVKIGGPPYKKNGGGPVFGRDYFWKVLEGFGKLQIILK